jgi:hypothetical protein
VVDAMHRPAAGVGLDPVAEAAQRSEIAGAGSAARAVRLDVVEHVFDSLEDFQPIHGGTVAVDRFPGGNCAGGR